VNRGVEIGSEIADDIDRSLIRASRMGVAVRMACLEILTRDLGQRPAAAVTVLCCRISGGPSPPPSPRERGREDPRAGG